MQSTTLIGQSKLVGVPRRQTHVAVQPFNALADCVGSNTVPPTPLEQASIRFV